MKISEQLPSPRRSLVSKNGKRRVLIGLRMRGCPPVVIMDEEYCRERAAK